MCSLTGVTLFYLVFHKNFTALSQLESSIFFFISIIKSENNLVLMYVSHIDPHR